MCDILEGINKKIMFGHPCLSIEARRKVVSLHCIGLSISEQLEQENVEVSKC